MNLRKAAEQRSLYLSTTPLQAVTAIILLMMNSRLLIGLGIVGVIFLALVGPFVATFTDKSTPELKVPAQDAASLSVDHFFDTYLLETGQIIGQLGRDDTSLEDQANGLLLAASTNDQKRFASIFSWMNANLKQDNGLMASQWSHGQVANPEFSTHAELVVIRALLVASEKFANADYLNQAKENANKLLSAAYVQVGNGSYLMPSVSTRIVPISVPVTYLSSPVLSKLEPLTGDARWASITKSQKAIVDKLANEDDRLLADWASVSDSGEIKAIADPSGSGLHYSQNAQVAMLDLAASCDETNVNNAAKIWSTLNMSRERRSAISLDLDGSIANDGLSSAAAAASAAGAKSVQDEVQMYPLLDLADQIEENRNTAQDAAYAALGRVTLSTNWLANC